MNSENDMPRKLELGCGELKPEGFYGVDIRDTEACDQVENLDEEDWDLPSDYFEVIRAKDVFEHLENPINFMEEIYRIGAPGCKVIIQTPHLSSNSWTDPTHQRLAGFRTMREYFVAYREDDPEEYGRLGFYSDCDFDIIQEKIVFSRRKLFPWNYIIQPLVNSMGYRGKLFYEESFLSRIFPALNMEFVLKVPEDSEVE
ncbi:MAG: methyltransferase domain-containing protein [Candidatus Nanohaloarchaea archaeon]